MTTPRSLEAFLSLLVVLSFVPRPASGAGIGKGDVCPEVAIGHIVGGDGRDKLTQFRGQPVLFAEWMNVTYGMDGARRGVDMKQKYGSKGLQVFLSSMDVIPDDAAWAKAEALLGKSFPNHRCRICVAPPIPTMVGAQDMPPLVYLIGVDGTLRAAGGNSNVGGSLDKLVEAELAKAKSGWGKDPSAKQARAALYGKFGIAEAQKIVVATTNPSDAADLEAAGKEIDRFFRTRLDSIRFLMKSGRWQEAIDAAAVLRESIKGVPDFETAASDVFAELETKEAKQEIELEKKAKSLFSRIDAGKADKGVAKSLQKVASENPGTAVGTRALAAAKVAAELAQN